MAESSLDIEDRWVLDFDANAFGDDVRTLGMELSCNQGRADVAHMKKLTRWSNTCMILGVLTMGYCVNPFSIYLVSLGVMTRWTIVGHHVCHGGLHRNAPEYNRFKFGVGSIWRRSIDWLDWMLVEAWNVEHNQEHHYRLGERDDPDLVEENVQLLRSMRLPRIVKYAVVIFFMSTWKWFYYAPNTLKHLQLANCRRKDTNGHEPRAHARDPVTIADVFKSDLFTPARLLSVLAPFFIRQFVVLPLLHGLLMGPTAARNALVSMALAEVLTNVHSFLVIATNHTGDDLYRFDTPCVPRSGEFYMRQVISSTNFSMGTDILDFHHGFLNYQIEHHAWPDLSPMSYQKAAPRMRALCKKHGVPYVQQSVFARLKKTVDIMIGATSMRNFPHHALAAPSKSGAPASPKSEM